MNYVRKLGFEETPDYDFLRELFTKVLKNAGEAEDGVYDWMILNNGKGWEAGSAVSHHHPGVSSQLIRYPLMICHSFATYAADRALVIFFRLTMLATNHGSIAPHASLARRNENATSDTPCVCLRPASTQAHPEVMPPILSLGHLPAGKLTCPLQLSRAMDRNKNGRRRTSVRANRCPVGFPVLTTALLTAQLPPFKVSPRPTMVFSVPSPSEIAI